MIDDENADVRRRATCRKTWPCLHSSKRNAAAGYKHRSRIGVEVFYGGRHPLPIEIGIFQQLPGQRLPTVVRTQKSVSETSILQEGNLVRRDKYVRALP